MWHAPLQSEHSWTPSVRFVIDYLAAIKPFYRRLNTSSSPAIEYRAIVACFDLLITGLGEVAGGSLREEGYRFSTLRCSRTACARTSTGGAATCVGWWRAAWQSRFGLGFERLISRVGGVENVRECVEMPRWAGKMLW